MAFLEVLAVEVDSEALGGLSRRAQVVDHLDRLQGIVLFLGVVVPIVHHLDVDPATHFGDINPNPDVENRLANVYASVDDVDLWTGGLAEPPARGGQGQGRVAGSGSGPDRGTGPGTGDGGVYTIGSGISNPQILVQTTPSYTDEAIKSKVQGIVILQAVIRHTGRVDSFKVLRALGYGLEEQAIQEIAQNWRFRPGTLNGKPVDVLATIEVQFNLR